MVGTEVDEASVSCDVSPDESVTRAVLRAVSVFRNQETTALEEPLYHAIDPEALDRVFTARSVGKLTFEYCGCTVTVRSTGRIHVEAAPSSH